MLKVWLLLKIFSCNVSSACSNFRDMIYPARLANIFISQRPWNLTGFGRIKPLNKELGIKGVYIARLLTHLDILGSLRGTSCDPYTSHTLQLRSRHHRMHL